MTRTLRLTRCATSVVAMISAGSSQAVECTIQTPASVCYVDYMNAAEQEVHAAARVPDGGKREQAVDDAAKGIIAGTDLGALATSLLNTLPTAGIVGLSESRDQVNVPNVGAVINPGLTSETADSIVRPAVVLEPQVFPPLRDKLEQAGATERLQQIAADLDPSDAVDLGVTVAMLEGAFGIQFGRMARRHRQLFENLVAGSLTHEKGKRVPIGQIFQRVQEVCNWSRLPENPHLSLADLATPHESQPAPVADTPMDGDSPPSAVSSTATEKPPEDEKEAKTSEPNQACVDAMIREFRAEAERYRESWAERVEAYHKAQLHDYATLVSNQAQLHFALRHAEVDAFVGPRVTSGRITLELAFSASLDSFLKERDNKEICSSRPDADECFRRYSIWITTSKQDSKPEHNVRVAFFVEGARLGPVDVTVDALAAGGGSEGTVGGIGDDIDEVVDPPATAAPIELHVPGVTRVKLGLTAGRTLWRVGALRDSFAVRLEAGADWTWFDVRDTYYNERVRGYAGLVFKVLGFSIPVQGVYASRSEYDVAGPFDKKSVFGGVRVDIP